MTHSGQFPHQDFQRKTGTFLFQIFFLLLPPNIRIMKKPVLFFAALLFGIYALRAQTADTLENPGFEKWEVPFGLPANHPEPVNWSAIKTSDNSSINSLAPVNWARSDSAHSGNYSVKLFNVSTFGKIATGTLTNGRIHTPADMDADKGYVYTDTSNSLWNTPFSGRPDSLTGWYMFFPKQGDKANVTAILHVGYAQSPAANGDSSTWIAKASFDTPAKEVPVWTRFSVPFEYFSDKTPQYILFVLTSGNGVNAKEGSYIYYDDLKVVFNPTGIKTVKNGTLKVFAYNKKLHLALQHAPGGIYRIKVLNILGRVQYTTTLQNGQTKTIELSLPRGIYLVEAQNGNHVMVQKVLIH